MGLPRSSEDERTEAPDVRPGLLSLQDRWEWNTPYDPQRRVDTVGPQGRIGADVGGCLIWDLLSFVAPVEEVLNLPLGCCMRLADKSQRSELCAEQRVERLFAVALNR